MKRPVVVDIPALTDNRAVIARVAAIEALERMGLVPEDEKHNYNALKRLLGYSIFISDGDFCLYMTKQDVETLELLAGPNGYAIYKMLKARPRRRIKE